MKIVCATNMPFVKEAFSTLGDAVVVEGRTMAAADVRDADLLALRSTTQVGPELLDGSSVRFVGTATIGTDHMDKDYLDARGIRWCHSPGCNANSVSEYVTAALLCLGERHDIRLAGKTLGIVGVGNVGRRVVEKAEALGMRVLRNDPPRQRAEAGDGPSPFVGLDQLLEEADVVTLHVPLTREGEDPTLHLAGKSFFARLKPGALFLNCARGAVVDTNALLDAMDRGVVAHAVIDTWEGEPNYRADLLERVDIGTPHIAGHSFEGKVAGTVMVFKEACRFLGVESDWSVDPLLPPPLVPEVRVDKLPEGAGAEERVLRHVVSRVYDIEADDRRMRGTEPSGEPVAPSLSDVQRFDWLRKNYPVRREFRFTRVKGASGMPGAAEKLGKLEFRL